MCEQTEINYLDGEVVWVKLGSCWWPGEVVSLEALPPDVVQSFRKPPIAVVKFFLEDTYEYVKNINSIYKYNCSRKDEFIKKGLYMYRTKHGHMEKFPEDVIRAETAVGGDIEILKRDEFQETKKESYAGIFGDSKKTPMSVKKGKNGRGRPRAESPIISTPIRKLKEKTDYKVHILVQGSKSSNEVTSEALPSTSSASNDLPSSENKTNDESTSQNEEKLNETVENNDKLDTVTSPTPLLSIPMPSTPAPSTPRALTSSAGIYACHACPFTTTRINVLILHNKTHSVTYLPYTPSPARKKVVSKSPPKSQSTSKTTKTPKPRKPRKEKTENKKVAKKRASQEVAPVEVKKPKTDEEIKSSLLADWDDDVEDESNDESSAMVSVQSPEVPVGSESPAVPTPAELPTAEVPSDICPVPDKKSNSSPSTDKPESSSDSKYEFCEDEDWPEEADIGRKIPRVKNPIRTDDTKSVSIDDEEVAREVAELLNKTAVPELPSVPEPLKIEENFPERSIVKSPDKKDTEKSPDKPVEKSVTDAAPSKVIFKTKTFFRSRHSRSQDAIGKYVAEQLNAVEKMDIAENEINGSEAVSSPDARDSPPIEPVKVARLAPKIQLKKMKAEAAQLREKEKMFMEMADVEKNALTLDSNKSEASFLKQVISEPNLSEVTPLATIQDVVYPSELIKPVNVETDTFITEGRNKQPNVDPIITSEKETPKEEVAVSYDESEVRKFEDSAILTDTYTEEPIKSSIENSNENSQSEHNEVVQENDNISVPELVEKSLTRIEEISNDLQKESLENGQIPPYMNESTASAVDALLSVSREPDRVPKVISNDLPEDLFEDDNKDSEVAEVSNGGFNENIAQNNLLPENCLEQPIIDHVEKAPEHIDEVVATNDEVQHDEVVINDTENTTTDISEIPENNIQEPNVIETTINEEPLVENVPSESDLQIAEALINLPATAIQSNTNEIEENVTIPFDNIQEVPETENVINETEIPMQDNEVIESEHVDDTEILNNRFESEHEKSENLNAAQSLVQMSEFIEHKTIPKQLEVDSNKIADTVVNIAKHNNGIEPNVKSVEQNISLLASNSNSETKPKSSTYDQCSSKLLKILEEPVKPKLTAIKTTTASTGKQIIMSGKDKILNFDVAKSTSFKSKTTPKQKIIIRRTATPSGANKTVLNNVSDLAGSDKIILSRSGNPAQDGSAVQTFTIKTSPEQPSDANTIIIQQKIRKISKPAIIQPKLQKIKPQTSLITSVNEIKTITQPQATDDAMFDINSMPIVLSEDLLTPESIEKMPVVMSDANIISQSQSTTKVIKPNKPNIIEHEKVAISSTPHKQEVKTLLLNPVSEVTKSITPNILSKSSKLRGAKPMLVIDKTTGKQKLIMTKSEPIVKEVKHAPTLIQSTQQAGKSEKFLILPTQSPAPRPTRTQKIVIDPQTGKAHVIVAKGSDAPISTENKPVSAKLVPTNSDASAPGNTVMIITNAQGAQSRIVLTPEHEKILFPNKQQPKLSQLKTVAHRITSASAQKTVTSIPSVKTHSLAPVKTPAKAPARIVPKPKSAIITSKGQLIVGGRVATTAQNIAPMPELRPVNKRIITSEPKKLVQKNTSEPIIFLQQKSGAMMQLTASQFEHMQRTGQIVQQKITPAPMQEKVVIQKVKSSNDPGPILKSRARKTTSESPTPSKKIKHEIAIAPAPAPSAPPAPVVTVQPPALLPTAAPAPSTSNFSEFENFEELLPSTAIVRQPEPSPVVEPEPSPAAGPPAPLSDGQLLAVPGEHFGGPVGTFYLCVEDNGTYTPIDNRPLVLENNQLVPMSEAPAPPPPERRDILEAALANSDVFHENAPRDDAPDFRDLNANVSVHCRVSETSTTLNQPIMTPVEVPSGKATELAVHSSMEDGLAVIGVTPHTVPTSLELPITVTDPRIAPKTTDPLGGKYGAPLLAGEPYVGAEVISMPLLTADDAVGKSMPLLTEEARSPASEPDWARRSDTSDASAEIPLQPHLQLSVDDLHRAS